MPNIVEQQRALLEMLQEEKRQEAEETALIQRQRASEGIMVHPHTQRAYRWVGNRLVPISSRYIDGLAGNNNNNEKSQDNGLLSLFKEAWNQTWGQIFSIPAWEKVYGKFKEVRKKRLKELGIGQAAVVLDPWGMPTTHLPISVRKEIEYEQEMHRVICADAPFSHECQGYFGDLYGRAWVYRVDDYVTGRARWPHYAIPYRDRFGMVRLATGEKHPHLAVNELRRAIKQNQVAKLETTFDETQFGYDHKMLLYKASI